MSTGMRPRAFRARIWAATVVALAISLAPAAAANTSRAGSDSGIIKLDGDAALIDTNVGATGSKEYFEAVVRVVNSIPSTQNLTVEFVVKRGSRVLRTVQSTAGIRRGGGVVSAPVVLEKKGTYTVEAQFIHFEQATADAAVTSARIGKARFIRNEPPLCSMAARLTNPSRDPLDVDVYFVGLRGGRIVAFGHDKVFDQVGPRTSAGMKADLITCVKVDEVRAYVETDGVF